MKDELPDEQLDALLREWKVDAEPNPRFSESVWRHIARRKAEAGAATWSVRWRRWTGRLTRRAEFAWGAAAALVAIAGAGWLGHRTAAPRASSPNSSSYLASVDPYRMTP